MIKNESEELLTWALGTTIRGVSFNHLYLIGNYQ